MLGFDLIAGQGADRAAETSGALAFLADGLALARRERGEEGVEIFVIVVFPVELLGLTAQQTHAFARPGLFFGTEGHMQRRQAIVGRQPDRALYQRRGADFGKARPGEKAPTGGRGEGHRNLKLGVIVAAGVLIGMRPIVVEDIFALAVALGIKRRAGDHLAAQPRGQVGRLPAGAAPDRAAGLKRLEKAVGGERVKRPPAVVCFGAGTGIPDGGADLGYPVMGLDFNLGFAHHTCLRPSETWRLGTRIQAKYCSKVILQATRRAAASCAGVRTVQHSTGTPRALSAVTGAAVRSERS